jgi:hypothetical protein
MKLLAVALSLCAMSAAAQSALEEIRYAGAPNRNAQGKIVRRADVLAAFQRVHPCPVTGLTSGACPGWSKNHVVPLACGGADAVWNMQWLPNDIKSCSAAHCVDRFERHINASDPPQPDTAMCVNTPVP